MKRIFFLALLSTASAEFPKVYNSESTSPPSAEDALTMFTLPEGMSATVFAAEPDVQNPIAVAWDTKSRMWVAENYTYAEPAKRFDLTLRDRVIILEDADGDGKAEKRTVFCEDLQMLTSVEMGKGGIYVMCPPQLLFIADKDGDDVPDGAPEVILDGFTVAESNYHNFANGLRWGPDGWLYGRCGGSCPGKVGAPGTPEAERIPLDGGIWRYHVERKFFEVLTHGTTNPWGHDWDENGEGFFINTVNGHLWHLIPGAHLERPFGRNPNKNIFEAIQMHADHWHFDTTGKWQDSRAGKANDFGGGHAHIGMCICRSTLMPESWQGKLLTWNQHGRRLNMERLEREGSGYVARHESDAMLAGDEWFRGIDIRNGPDGALFALDWSDTGECHDHSGVHRESGRIYRFVAKNGAERKRVPFVSGANDRDSDIVLLSDGDERKRVWAIRRLTDFWPIDSVYGPMVNRVAPDDQELLAKFVEMAKLDESGLVRLALASTIQRLPVVSRPALACALAGRVEDAEDHNLPNMIWFGMMTTSPEARMEVARATQWPKLLRWIARSLAGDEVAVIDVALSSPVKAPHLFGGLLDGFKGWKAASKPENWDKVVAAFGDSAQVQALSALYGDGVAMDGLKMIALDEGAGLSAREKALQSLIDGRVDGLREICESLLKTRKLNRIAVRGLGVFDDAAIGEKLAAKYQKFFQPDERGAVVDVLVSRPAWAKSLLSQIEAGGIPRGDLTPFHARQIMAFEEEALKKRLVDVWGDVRQSDEAKHQRIAEFHEALTSDVRGKADLSRGRLLFQGMCASCHTLYGQGGKLGPDLTGSGRADLRYLLENIVDPSAVVSAEYRMSVLKLKDERVLSGVVVAAAERTVTLRSLTEEVTIERAEIVSTELMPNSVMPEGLLDALTAEQVRDLVAYLMHQGQVELP
jgi:putative membrane-bound dehydrogenase-like protein